MGAQAIVAGDKITGQCPSHLMPNPATGAPQPAPPMPFSAPLTMGTVATVLIGGKPNVPPHVGLHPSDLFLAPPQQVGRVTSGSATVMIGGKPAATAQSTCTCCSTPGTRAPTVTTVQIG
jgi:uncharacterized Zn-binding protein involved in type VI secretion